MITVPVGEARDNILGCSFSHPNYSWFSFCRRYLNGSTAKYIWPNIVLQLSQYHRQD
jgi:hypothetical protein